MTGVMYKSPLQFHIRKAISFAQLQGFAAYLCLGFVEVAGSQGCVAVCEPPEVWQIISLPRLHRLDLRGNCIYTSHAVPSWGTETTVYTYHSFFLNEEIDFSMRVCVPEYV